MSDWKKSLRDHRLNAISFAKRPYRRRQVSQASADLDRCHYCKLQLSEITRDHIVPIAKGGSNQSWNIVPACLACNQAKAESWPTCACGVCRDSVRRHAEMGVTPFTSGPRPRIKKGRKK